MKRGVIFDVAVEWKIEVRAGQGVGCPLFPILEVFCVVGAGLREDADGRLCNLACQNVVPTCGAVAGIGIPIDARSVGSSDDAKEAPRSIRELGEKGHILDVIQLGISDRNDACGGVGSRVVGILGKAFLDELGIAGPFEALVDRVSEGEVFCDGERREVVEIGIEDWKIVSGGYRLRRGGGVGFCRRVANEKPNSSGQEGE